MSARRKRAIGLCVRTRRSSPAHELLRSALPSASGMDISAATITPSPRPRTAPEPAMRYVESANGTVTTPKILVVTVSSMAPAYVDDADLHVIAGFDDVGSQEKRIVPTGSRCRGLQSPRQQDAADVIIRMDATP